LSEICPICGLPKEICVCEEIAKEKQEIKISTEYRRYGKKVTVISGINPSSIDLCALITDLKKECACGGTIKNGNIELQGDHGEKVKERLEKMGFRIKFS
jgi:translation initiation factor 1